LANTGFQTVYNNIGLESDWTTAWSYALVIWNLGKWNLVKWNETRRIGAIFASFWVARVCQRQLSFLVIILIELATMTSPHIFNNVALSVFVHCILHKYWQTVISTADITLYTSTITLMMTAIENFLVNSSWKNFSSNKIQYFIYNRWQQLAVTLSKLQAFLYVQFSWGNKNRTLMEIF